MGYIGDKIHPQRLHSGQFLRHFIEIISDHIKLIDTVRPVKRLNPHGKVSLHNLLGSLQDSSYRTLHSKPAPHPVGDRTQQAQKQDIDKCDLRRIRYLLLCKLYARYSHQGI